MTLLNQIVAIEAGQKSTAERSLTDAYHLVQKEPLFNGLSRTYTPKDDDGEQLPPESTKVQQNVQDIIAGVTRTLTRLFDITLTKDVANTEARADIIVNGAALAENVPVTYLLFLEKQLLNLRTFVGKLPVLDPAFNWTPEPGAGPGIWGADPVQTTRSVKVPRALVKYEATVQHPAQVETYTENVVVGTWTARAFSGRISRERQTEILQRIELLSEAVKMAREQANTREVQDRQIGQAVIGMIFGP